MCDFGKRAGAAADPRNAARPAPVRRTVGGSPAEDLTKELTDAEMDKQGELKQAAAEAMEDGPQIGTCDAGSPRAETFSRRGSSRGKLPGGTPRYLGDHDPQARPSLESRLLVREKR